MRKIKPLGKGSSGSRLIKALGKDKGFAFPLRSQTERRTGVSESYESFEFRRELSNALLEAELYKAKATMELQRYPFNR